MFDNFNFEIARLFKKCEKEMENLKHPYVGSEHLLLALLDENDNLCKTLNNYGVTYNKFKSELVEIVGIGSKKSDLKLYTPLLKRVIDTALADAKEDNNGKVTTTHLFLALLEESEGIAIRILVSLDVDLDKLYKDLHNRKIPQTEKLTIYEIGNNLNESVNLDEKVVGRDKELNLLIETLLRKNKNNPLLVGKAGTGKTAIVEELARLIKKGEVTKELQDKKIIMLEMSSLVAGTKYRGEFEERFNKIIDEVIKEKDIILFIDEIHTMVNAGGAEGAIDAANILKPYLARGSIACIGATTLEEYDKFIAKDKALERRFQKILIKEPNASETEIILKAIKKEYEDHHHIHITNKNIKDIIFYVNKYIYNKNNPDKCIDVLDSVCAKVKLRNLNNDNTKLIDEKIKKMVQEKKQAIIKQDYALALKHKTKIDELQQELTKAKTDSKLAILKRDILKVIENKSNIPLLENKPKIFKQLKTDLEKNIIGQNEAIKAILNNFKQNFQKENNRPNSVLLTGPTGVGKTYTIKLLAKSLGINFIRLDMSEYNLETAVNKLIGVSAGYVGYDDNYIFKQVLENPYSIILLDEIEKASPKVLNLFLQILDEGYITSSNNEVIRFDNTMIYMTSNAIVNNSVGFSKSIKNNEYLSKELLNRLNLIVNYQAVDKEMARQYLKEKIRNEDEDKILNNSNFERFGYRELERCLKAYENSRIL